MTERSWHDWHLVGQGSDPIPVDRWDIGGIADDLRERATQASSIRSRLSRLSRLDGWAGEAAQEFGEKSGKVLEDLGKVVDRYEDVAAALDWWAEAVDGGRTRTRQAVLDAEDAQRRIQSNDVDLASGPEPSKALLQQQSEADERKAQAVDDLAAAQQAMRTAMSDLDAAAETTGRKIDAAADQWDDGTWGNVKGFLRKGAELVEFLCAALEVIAVILGALILVLALTVGAPFVLLMAALLASLAILAGHLFLMVLDEGDIGWDDIGLDVLNVALSMTGLKLLGPAVTNGLRGLQAAVPTIAMRAGNAARMAAVSRITSGQTRLYANSLRFANPTGPLGRWARGVRTQADVADVVESTRILAMANRQPGGLARLIHGDRELAQLHVLVRDLRAAGSGLGPLELGQLRHLQQVVHAGVGVNTVSTGLLAGDLPDVPDNVRTVIDSVREHPIDVSRLFPGIGCGFDLRPVP